MDAAAYGHTAVVQMLIKAGAALDAQDHVRSVKAICYVPPIISALFVQWGDTALALAASRGKNTAVQALIGAGASIDSQNWVTAISLPRHQVSVLNITLCTEGRNGLDGSSEGKLRGHRQNAAGRRCPHLPLRLSEFPPGEGLKSH
jgi:ankyrin repeat protein